MDIKKLARKNILSLTPYKGGKPIEELERELGIKDIAKIASNENPLGSSKKVYSSIKKNLKKINRYPDGNSFNLKKALAEKFNVKNEQIILGNGSNEIIELVLRVFLENNDEVIVSKPSFLVYKLATLVEGGVVKEIPLLSDFSFDLKGILNAITDKTKIIFIDNPNNPAGTSVGKAEIENFISKVPDKIIIVLDEAYNEFVDRNDFPDSLRYVKEKNNVIVARTFSKAHGLSGLRIGYAVANSEIVELVNKVRQPFNINYIAQIAALASLEDDAFIEKSKNLVRNGKQYLYVSLDKLKIKYIKSDTNFILMNVENDSRKIFEEMLKEGIIVRNMYEYGLPTYIRVTVGLPKENRKFIKAIGKVLSKS